MSRRLSRWTVVLIPQTDRRPIRFQIPTVAPSLVGLLFLSVTAAALFLGNAHKQLETRIASLSELEQVNLDQRREIEAITTTMTNTVRETDVLLDRLRALEAELEQLLRADTGETAASAEAPDGALLAANAGGRGGGLRMATEPDQTASFSNSLSEVARQVTFGPQRGALLASRGAADRTSTGTLEQAQAIQGLMDAQLAEADLRLRNLTAGKTALIDLLDYLAHKPTGMPVAGDITDAFGLRWSPFGWGRQHHYGIDIAAPYWDPIQATADGVVIFAGWKQGGYGYTVIIDHGHEFQTLYAHMVDYDVTIGDEVTRGQVIGYVGSTGLSTGPHLHYEVHVNGVEVDPLKYAQ